MKKFAMSMFANKEQLLEAKCLYLEQQLSRYRDVAVQADVVLDTYSYVAADVPNNDFVKLKEALEKVEL